jgi:hypothetical protein
MPLPDLTIPAAFAPAVLGLFAVLLAATTVYHLRESLIHPLVLVNVVLVYFVFAPAAYLLVTGNFVPMFAEILPAPTQAIATTLTVSVAMYVALLVVFYALGWFDGPRDWIRALLTRETATPTIPSRTLFWVGIVGFAAGLLSYAYYVTVNGGFMRFVTITPRLAFQTVPNTGRYRLAALAGVYGGFITTWAAARPCLEGERWTDNRRTVLALAVVSIVAFAVLATFRARWELLVPAAFALSYLWTLDYVSDRVLIGAGVVVLVAGMAFSAIEYLLTGHPGAAQALINGIVHLPRIQILIAIVARVPETVPFQGGATYTGPFFLAREVLSHHDPHRTFAGTGLAEPYLNFGVLGLVAAGAAFGVLCRITAWVRSVVRATTNAIARGLYPTLLVAVVFLPAMNITGALWSVWLRIFLPVGLALCVAWVLGRIRQHPAIPISLRE